MVERPTGRRNALFGAIHLGLIYAMGYLLLLGLLPGLVLVLWCFAEFGAAAAIAAALMAVPLCGICWLTIVLAPHFYARRGPLHRVGRVERRNGVIDRVGAGQQVDRIVVALEAVADQQVAALIDALKCSAGRGAGPKILGANYQHFVGFTYILPCLPTRQSTNGIVS